MPQNSRRADASYRQKINIVLAYIREHLHEPLHLEELACVACLSPFHFHRIFSAFTGESLHQHVKRLRLEQAAARLLYSREPVGKIATENGYISPAAFSKAFTQHFGVTPSAYKTQRAAVPERAAKSSWGVPQTPDSRALECRYERRAPQRVLYVRRTGKYDVAAAQAWETLMRFAGECGLLNAAALRIGVTYDFPEITDEEHTRYEACLACDAKVPMHEDISTQTLRGGEFAVFEHAGAYETLWATYDAIYSRWLPAEHVVLANAPSYAVYLNDPYAVAPEQLRTQICIPVQSVKRYS